MTLSEPERASEIDAGILAELARVAGQLIDMFETASEVLERVQDLVPAPSLEDVAAMREGSRPLTREAYLLGLFQRAMLGAENLASDLRVLVESGALDAVHEIELSIMELNAIEEAVSRRT